MRRALLLSTLLICFSASVEAQSSHPHSKAQANLQSVATASPSPAAVQAAKASFAKLPLSFEENQGQTDSHVKFVSRGFGYNLFLTEDEAVFALRGGRAASNCAGLAANNHLDCADPSKQGSQGAILGLKILGANASAQVSGSEPLPGKLNYYIGNDPSKWRTGVRQFGRVTYRGIYSGVDVTYYGNQQQLESDFIVAPGANPRSIEFEVRGARGTHLDRQGNLVLVTAVGDMHVLRPGVYQVVKGIRREVSGEYVIRGENRVGVKIGSYDKRNPLIIDPFFVYSTYLGGSDIFSGGGDAGNAIAIDSTGAAYVTGSGQSLDFPGAGTGPVAETTPFAFVTKFDPTGNNLVYSTLLRGTTGFADSGNGIAVNGTNAYVTGITSDADFPLLNPFQATIGDDPIQSQTGFIQSGFVTGLASDGTLLYSTYLGGRNSFNSNTFTGDSTTLRGLAVDSTGNAYVVGDTTSQNFPTVNPLQATNNSSTQAVVTAKFNPQGQPIYSTYFGGTGFDTGYAIAADAAGNAYITGQTSSAWISFPAPPASPTPFQAKNNGSDDAFVAKLSFNTSSSTLSVAASTFLGGDGADTAHGIAVDAATPPNVYLTGQTFSTIGSGINPNTGVTAIPFPTQHQLFGPNNLTPLKAEAFVTELAGDFHTLAFSTFLGGTAVDVANAIAIDASTPPNVFVTGGTGSLDFPVLNPLQIPSISSGHAIVAEININGASSALKYSTYLEGTGGSDQGLGVAVDSLDNAYITGTTTSSNFPVLSSTPGGAPFQDSLRSSQGNAFVTKISSNAAPSALNFNPPLFNYHEVGVGSFISEYFTLSNNSGTSVTISSFSISGINAGDFAVQAAGTTCTTTTSLVLNAGSSCVLVIRFTPQDQDARTAQVGISSTPPSTTTLALTGFGAVPEVALSQTTVDFGTNDPLNVSTPSGVTITNTGGGTLHVGSVQITGTGTDASAFKDTVFNCATVLPHQSCSISLSFIPTVAGHTYSGTLLINDDAVGSPQSLPMTGAGVAQVNLNPKSSEFGGWLVGTSSGSRGFSLQNGSGGNITLTGITPGGAFPGDFPSDNNAFSFLQEPVCAATLVLLPGVTCDFSVHFAPTAGSAIDGRTGTYTFTYTGALSGSQTISLMGAGETGVTLYENSIPGPGDPLIQEYVGATRRGPNVDQLFNGTSSNGTSSPITVTGITLSGANPGDFVIELDNSCSTNGVVPANSVCYLDGAFTPAAVGTRTATATIHYTPPSGSSLTLNITATGFPGPVSFPGGLDMGSQIVGLTGAKHRVVLQNIGKLPLQIASVAGPTGANSSDFTVVTDTCLNGSSGILVPAGGKCFLDLRFTPGATGSRTASITVTDNGPGSPRTLILKGTGEPGSDTISVTPSALDFGNIVLLPGTAQPTVTATFYLTNGSNGLSTINVAPALTNTTAPQPFALGTGTCSSATKVLPQGGVCTVVVSFTPTPVGTPPSALGLQTNSVTLTDSVGGLHTVPVQATVVTQGILSLSAVPIFTQLPSTTSSTAQTLTLTNTGNGPLTITVIAPTGTDATDFAIVPSPAAPPPPACAEGASIAAGSSCVIGVTFTSPAKVGTYTGNALVTANLGNNVTKSATAGLTGIVVSGGFAVTPADNPLDLGTVAIGASVNFSTISGNFISLTNNNPSAVNITSIAPQNAGHFSVTSSNCNVSIQAASSCAFDVTFAPAANVVETNNLDVTYTINSGSPQHFLIAVKGTGSNALVATPNIALVSASTTFAGTAFFTISNGSSSSATITGLGAFTGANASYYSIAAFGDSCTGQTLAPTSSFPNSCSISVTFTPTAAGTNLLAQLPVNYTVGATQQTLQVKLSGTATAPQISIVPASPTPLTFGNQVVNTQSLVLNVLVTNTGSDFVNFSGYKITGPNANDFALAPQIINFTNNVLSGSCEFGVQPGQTCTIPLTFTPSPLTTADARSATLTITDTAGTQTVVLAGNSTGRTVSVSPNSITFPDTNLGFSTTQSVLVTNASNAAVTFTNVTFGTASFSVDASQSANACSNGKQIIAFTGSCVVYIKFTPQLAGANSDTATILTTSGSPIVTLSGTGKSSAVTVSPTSVAFTTPQLVGTSSTPVPVTLTNGTPSTITISGTIFTGDYLAGTNSCTGSIAPGNTCTVNVIFKPTATGSRPGSLQISENGTPPSVSVTLSGTGTAPATIAASGGTPQSVVVNSAFAALQATVKDTGGNGLSGVSVTFIAPASGASGTFALPGTGATATVTTNASGVATAPTFTANNILGGPYTVAATTGSLAAANFSLTNLKGIPASIAVSSGSPQSVAITAVFGPMQAIVKDGSSLPLSGVVVTFTAPTTGATGTFAGTGATATATTNASGIATAPTFTANGIAGGPYNVAATAGAVVPADFVLTNLTGAPASVAASAGGGQSAVIKTTFTTNLQVIVKDAGSNLLSGVNVIFTAPASGASGTFAASGATVTVQTNASGVATAPAFTANSIAAGYTVTAVVGSLAPASFSMTNTAGLAANIAATAGASQSVAVNTAFATNLQATVTDSGGNPVSGASVTFTAPGSGASGIFAAPGTGVTATVATNASGVATAPVLTSNSTIGAYAVNATVSGAATPAAFSLTNLAGLPASIAALAGSPQSTTISSGFATNLQAKVTDSGGNPVNGASVTFTAPASGASGTFASPGAGATATVATNAGGVATAPVFTANSTAGAFTVSAKVATVATAASFSLTNNAGPAATIVASAGTPQNVAISTAFATKLQAKVTDSGGNAVSGASVTFTAPASGASGAFAAPGAGATATVTTDASGLATAPTFTANSTAGAYSVTAKAAGVTPTATFLLTNNAGLAATIVPVAAGTPQSAQISHAFGIGLQATVTDSGGNPVSGASVTFTAPATGASGTFASPGTGATAAVTTNASGVASAPAFTANSTTGAYSVSAKVTGVATSASFSLKNTAGPAANLASTAGTPQSVAVNTAFAALQATVTDSGGNPVSGASVTFTAPASGASGTFAAPGTGATATVTTNASGVATAPIFSANSVPGIFIVKATSGALTAVNFNLTNLTAPPAAVIPNAGSGQSATISTAFPINLQATVNDSGGHPIAGVKVTFTAPATGASGTFASPGTGNTATATTNASGIATAPIFTANGVAGGPYNVVASTGAFSGNFSLTNQVGPAAAITAASAASESATINTAFAPMQVTVKDSGGNLVTGATVTFTVTAATGGASGAFVGGTTATATTNASGVATAPTFTANSVAGGPFTVNASSGSATTFSFSLTNLPGPATVIVPGIPASQSAAVNTAFAALQVTVKDGSGNGISGASVTFTAPSSGATGMFAAPGTGATATVNTNASGVATAPTFTANNTVGGPYTVVVTSGSLPAVNFALTNLAGTPASITATSGTPQSVAILAAFLPLQATVKDSHGLALSGVVVTFTAPATGASGTFTGSVTTVTATTDASGVATAPAFTANGTAGGPYVVTATAAPLAAANFNLTNLAGAPASITVTGGGAQSAAISTAFGIPLQATVKDSGGNLLGGVIVTFTAPASGASGTFGSGATTQVTTNASGVANATAFTANSTVGVYIVNATVSGVTAPAAYSLTNSVGPAATIAATVGTPQSATVSTAFATTLQVVVKDSGGNPVSGATVTFTAPATGASGTFASPGTGATAAAMTNASGIATSPLFTANTVAGAYAVSAKVATVTTSAAFSLTNLAGPPVSITAKAGTPQSAPVTTAYLTALQATVKDASGNLITGATVTFTAPASGASGTFMGSLLTAAVKTDSSGNATAPTFTANAIGGAYSVNASVAGVSTNAVFALTNTVAPDVTITKSHSGDFTVGANGTYTIKVTNNGTGPTTGTVTVTDTLPAGLGFVSATTTGGWSCSGSGQTVTCANATVGVLAAKGGSSTVTLTVSVGPNAITSSSAAGFTVTNSATVSDPNDTVTTDKLATDTPTNIDNIVPSLSAFTPALGFVAGATTDQTIVLTGTGFNASTSVNFGSVVLTGTASPDGKTLTITIPHGDLANTGNVTVSVNNPKNPTTSAGGGPNPLAQNQTLPVVGIAIAPHTGTPNPAPVVAGTPFALQVDVPTTPAGAKLPADVNITCSFPAALTGATCTANPATITQGTTSATSTITINAVPTKAAGASVTKMDGRGPWPTYLLWLVAAALISMLGMAGAGRQRTAQLGRAPVYLTLVLLVLAAGALVGCTTNGSNGPTPTPTGPSTVTVTATTADGASVSTVVNINVTN